MQLAERLDEKRKVNQSVSTLVIVTVSVVCAAGILSWKLGWEKSVWKEKLDPQPVDIYLSKDGIEWEVYDDPIPLRVEDMKETGETVYSYKWTRKDESILAKCYAAAQRERGENNAPELYYQIVEVRLPVLYDLCLNGLQQDDWWVEDEEFSQLRMNDGRQTESIGNMQLVERKKHRSMNILFAGTDSLSESRWIGNRTAKISR